ncbi:MAG TPA: signal peptidase I, partial [Acidimicrobiia bacterium]|nr:signal peptidase I [Acidimicrobiia bacterium]
IVPATCVIVAILWGVLPFVIDALLAGRAPAAITPAPITQASPPVTLTTIVCIGDEPNEVARASVALATEAGPAIAVAPSELAQVIAGVETDAVLIVSASAFPTRDALRVAGALHDDVGWVVGRVAAYNDDAYAPRVRALVESRRRQRARSAGLVTWEPDAVIVRTALLRALPLDRAAPRGSWLRSLAARGYRGVETDVAVARRAVPTDGPSFWPSEAMRRRAAAADLARATTQGSLRARVLACSGLARELYAYQLLLFLAAPVLAAFGGSFPFRCSAVGFAAVLGAPAIARWACSRRAIGFFPRADLRAAIYDIPGSLLALPSALTRRVRRPRFHVPEEPLLLAAIVTTVAVTLPLFDRPPTSDARIDFTVAWTIVMVAVLWTAAVRAIGPAGPGRASYRLKAAGLAVVDGRDGRIVDASPGGAAIAGPFATTNVGDGVSVAVTFAESGATVAVQGTVVARRASGAEFVLGIQLADDDSMRAAWIRGVADATAPASPASARVRSARRTRETVAERRSRRVLRRAQLAVVGTVSLAAVALLALVLVGYRPLVVRSGSMVPTFRVGDVAIADWIEANDLRPGDVVSFRDAELGGESITHRVRAVQRRGDVLHVETRGDANDSSEYWSTPSDALVGRVVGRVPGAGTVLSAIGRGAVRVTLLVLAAIVTAAAVLLAIARERRTRPVPTRV